MGGDENQKKVFEFLTEHLDSQEPFTKEDIQKITTWQRKTFPTYWSKQFEQFVIPAPNNKYCVSESFRPFTDWDKFRQHVTQVRRIASDYKPSIYINVLSFEFFMPLSNEAHLKATLDALFYKDTILARLKAQDEAELFKHFPKNSGEAKEAYLKRLCDWIAPRFLGYSISHVNGRFRAGNLCTREEAAQPTFRRRYIIDETTAVTRFIFPCQDAEDATRIRWFFEILFVKSIIQVVNGEDEIWMIESGLQNRVYIWRIDRSEPS
jgi:hypothetical protein